MSQEKKSPSVEILDASSRLDSPNSHDSSKPAPRAKVSLWRGLRTQPRLVCFGILISSLAILLGYESVGGISVVKSFLFLYGVPQPADAISTDSTTNSDYFLPSEWLALFAIGSPLGTALGSVLGGISGDRIGRRWTLSIGAIWQALCVTIAYLSDKAPNPTARCAVYLAGKVLQGIGVGALMSTGHTYISECLPPSIKGPIQALIAPFFLLGQIFASVAVSIASKAPETDTSSYHKLIMGQWITFLLPLSLMILLPESPVWNIRRGRTDDAQIACRRLQGRSTPEDDLFTYLQEMIAEQDRTHDLQARTSYADLFKSRNNLRRTLIVIFVMALPQMLGLPILGHAANVEVNLGMDATRAAKFTIIGGALGLIGSLLSFPLLGRMGRRPIMLTSVGILIFAWLAIGISGAFQAPIQANTSAAIQEFVIAILMVIVFFLSLGAWPASYAIAGETSSLELRAKSAGVGWASSQISTAAISVIAPYLYGLDALHLGAKLGYVFFAFCAAVWIVVFLFMPESKGLDAEEMDQLYDGPAIVVGRKGGYGLRSRRTDGDA